MGSYKANPEMDGNHCTPFIHMDGLPNLAVDFWNDEQMSKRLHLSKCQCGKVRFRDKREAISALHRIQLIAGCHVAEAGFTRRKESRAYGCSICKGYHLTSDSQMNEIPHTVSNKSNASPLSPTLRRL